MLDFLRQPNLRLRRVVPWQSLKALEKQKIRVNTYHFQQKPKIYSVTLHLMFVNTFTDLN